MKALTLMMIILLVLTAIAGVSGCSKDTGKVAPPDVSQPTAGPVVQIARPDLSKGVEKVDTSAYTDAQGMFIASIMDRMVDATG